MCRQQADWLPPGCWLRPGPCMFGEVWVRDDTRPSQLNHPLTAGLPMAG
jgi:hypothetical protein